MALTRLNNNAIGETITAAKGGTGVTSADSIGNLVKVSTATASSDSSIEFTTGIDSTYEHYKLIYREVHASAADTELSIQWSSDGGSTYNIDCVNGFGRVYNRIGSNSGAVDSSTAGFSNQITNTTKMILAQYVPELTGSAINGEIDFINPSDATYRMAYRNLSYGTYYDGGTEHYGMMFFHGGMLETAVAINALKFSISSGNMETGEFTLYGVKT
jgi:hypothetical protein